MVVSASLLSYSPRRCRLDGKQIVFAGMADFVVAIFTENENEQASLFFYESPAAKKVSRSCRAAKNSCRARGAPAVPGMAPKKIREQTSSM
jgi:hypothetical protein